MEAPQTNWSNAKIEKRQQYVKQRTIGRLQMKFRAENKRKQPPGAKLGIAAIDQ